MKRACLVWVFLLLVSLVAPSAATALDPGGDADGFNGHSAVEYDYDDDFALDPVLGLDAAADSVDAGRSIVFTADSRTVDFARLQNLSAPRALPPSSFPSPADAADLVRASNPVGSALQTNAFTRAPTWVVDEIASNGSVYRIVGSDGVERTLIQSPGQVNGLDGRFEWIVDDLGNLTHQKFVKGGSINGLPNTP